MIKGLANACSAARILFIPLCVFLLFYTPWFGWCFFIGLSLSDGLDGWIARRYNDVTSFGALLDPMADKLLSHAALWSYLYYHSVVWLVLCALLLTLRDASITVTRLAQAYTYGADQAVTGTPVTTLSKCKSFLLLFSIALGLYASITYGQYMLFLAADVGIVVATCMSVYSYFSGGSVFSSHDRVSSVK